MFELDELLFVKLIIIKVDLDFFFIFLDELINELLNLLSDEE